MRSAIICGVAVKSINFWFNIRSCLCKLSRVTPRGLCAQCILGIRNIIFCLMTTCYLYSFRCPLSNVYYSFYFRIVSNLQTERFHLDIWSVLLTFCSLVCHVYRLICKLEQINRAILVLLTLIGQLLRKIGALMILNSCPEVVRYTKALGTMYRQFPGLITKMKQKKYKITGLTILMLFA